MKYIYEKPGADAGPEITSDTLLRVASEPVSTAISGEAVILDSRSGRYFSMEGVGARIWELLQTTRRVSEIVAVLLDEYDTDEATCERDVKALVTELSAAELVTVHHPKVHEASSGKRNSANGTSS